MKEVGNSSDHSMKEVGGIARSKSGTREHVTENCPYHMQYPPHKDGVVVKSTQLQQPP
jgi:hypothetical protein